MESHQRVFDDMQDLAVHPERHISTASAANLVPPSIATDITSRSFNATPASSMEDTDQARSISRKAIMLIAREADIPSSDLLVHQGISFSSLGVDSLMSLVIVEKFKEELGVVVNGALFVEYPTVKDLILWLDENYG